MSKNENKKPKIRFQGFDEEWVESEIGAFGNIVTGSTPLTSDLNNYGGSHLFVSPIDIKDNRYIENTITTLTKTGYKKCRTLEKGSVLFVSIGSTIGKIAQLSSYGATNQQINAIEANDKFDIDYVYSVMQTNAKKIKGIASNQAVPIINKTTFSEYIVNITTNEIEQQKIGEYFKNIDNLISKKQKKYDKLVQMKSVMLEKMFPKENESVPEVRFSGFSDEWEESKLGELGEINSGRDYKHLEYGNIPVYGTGGYMVSVNEALSYAYNAIGIGRKGTINKPYKLIAPFWTVDTLFYVIPSKQTDLDFLLSMYLKIDWLSKDESTGLPSLSKKIIESVDITIAKHEEQQKIGNYFKTLENLILLQQKEIEKLKNIKKALLEKMFV